MEFISISKLNKKQYHDFTHLYHQSFPNNERKPLFYMKKLQRENKMSLYGIIKEDELIGLIIFIRSSFGYILDYLAIVEKYRCLGLGGQVLEEVYQHLQSQPVIVEIECVNEDPITAKRKAFYLRHHFKGSHIIVNFFQTDYELLSYHSMTYHQYQNILIDCFGTGVTKHLKQ